MATISLLFLYFCFVFIVSLGQKARTSVSANSFFDWIFGIKPSRNFSLEDSWTKVEENHEPDWCVGVPVHRAKRR